MKNISPLRLGLTFAGSFLGAGYVSGQEIWQFFGRFGMGALPGLALAMVLMGAIGVMLWELARGLELTEMDRLVVERDVPVLRVSLSAVQAVMLFGFTVIMCAGGVALCVQQWSLPALPCAAVLCAAVGCGAYVSLYEAMNDNVSYGSETEPDGALGERLKERFEVYKRLYPILKEEFKNLK